MELLGKYTNGNYDVSIYDDGTKIRLSTSRKLIPEFAESIDMNITNKCNRLCDFCYQGCTPDGKHCDFNKWIPLLEKIKPYTEVAINGNNLDHPDLRIFLDMMRFQKVIVNITVDFKTYVDNFDYLKELQYLKLIYGIGVSMNNTNINTYNISKVKAINNTVIHVVLGMIEPDNLSILLESNCKILLLGFKTVGRGNLYMKSNHNKIIKNISEIKSLLRHNLDIMNNKDTIISFDNLALKQLVTDYIISKDEFNKLYMGDDGEFTFYLDLVDGKYAKGSMYKDCLKDIDVLDPNELFKNGIRNNWE